MSSDLPEWGRDWAWQPLVPVLRGDEGTERCPAEMALQSEGQSNGRKNGVFNFNVVYRLK